MFVDGAMVAAPLAMVLIESYGKADANLLQLVKKQIDWGGYVTKAKAILDERRLGLLAASRRIEAELNASHQQEMAQRAAAAEAFSNTMYQQQLLNQNQQMINSVNRPVMTNCTHMGFSTNCTSY